MKKGDKSTVEAYAVPGINRPVFPNNKYYKTKAHLSKQFNGWFYVERSDVDAEGAPRKKKWVVKGS